MSNDTFNQNNVNGDNVINIGRPRFEITADLMAQILDRIDKSKPVMVAYKSGGRGQNMAQKLMEFLSNNGVHLGGSASIGTVSSLNPETPVSIHPNGIGNGMIGGGTQTVYIDPSI